MSQWEYTELLISLGFIRRLTDSPARGDEQLRRYRQIVLEHLEQAGREGWQPDGPPDPMDWQAMEAAGRLHWRTDIGFPAPNPDPTTIYQAVTIRLKRPKA